MANRNWFSNFLPFEESMKYQGLIFTTPEHFYQAMKTKDFDQRHHISLARTAAIAKQRGRSVTLRPDWEEIKQDVMMYALRYKFDYGTSWSRKLMTTEKDDIVEWNYWHDNIWGDCTCRKCQNIPGQNLLGKLLMQLRAEL